MDVPSVWRYFFEPQRHGDAEVLEWIECLALLCILIFRVQSQFYFWHKYAETQSGAKHPAAALPGYLPIQQFLATTFFINE